ncbi:MAG: hypothetical protein GKR98_03325 [Boseongicola sp.]|nr:MAG: hypothetical protein GKR98_03325 [Boseongicola sp.]
MGPRVFDIELSGLVLPSEDPELRRDRLGKDGDHDENYDHQYDFNTLVYDCFFDPTSREVLLLAPPLLNFQALLETAEFLIDGETRAPLRIENLSRCSVIAFAAGPEIPRSLSITHAQFGGMMNIGQSHLETFAGTNAIYSISRNNRLEWIQDWLHYYINEHGATSVILTDNGSTDYSPSELRDAIGDMAGLEQAAILRARYPFGPRAESKVNYASLFLQRSMAELCRRRFLGQARAVLNVDIDELFHSKSGQSVFDATVANQDGYVRADAVWVYATQSDNDGFFRHRDHRFVSMTGKPKANRKWCVVPQGPQKGRQWLTHFIGGRSDPVDPDFVMWHCRQISTSWKVDRSVSQEIPLRAELSVEKALDKAFVNAPLLASQAKHAPAIKVGADGDRSKKLIITSMKNEGPFILEWTAFHRAIGFNQFLVFTNDCSDGTDAILDRLEQLGVVKHERNRVLRRGPQKSALKHARSHPLVLSADWIFVSDVDEFLNIKVGDGRVDDLLDAVPDADVIPITWRLFSNDGLVDFDEGLVIEMSHDAERDLDQGGHIRRFAKSLFKPSEFVERFGTHGPIYSEAQLADIKWLSPTGRRISDPKVMTRPEVDFGYDVAQVNHYATRSVDAYLVKKDRGRVNHFRQVMGFDYWQKMNLGGQSDQSILRSVGQTREEMQTLLQDKELAALHSHSVHWYKNRIRDLRQMPEYEELRNNILEVAD